MVTKDFIEMVRYTSNKEGYPSIADFIRCILHERIHNINRMDRLIKIMEQDNGTENARMAN
ncbi:TPA: hypothetical protein HA246_07550 [Candidatus Woesearchaeota archaeon]|nr:hypothetical protein [Candidatus Woesearchaeota archaeon]